MNFQAPDTHRTDLEKASGLWPLAPHSLHWLGPDIFILAMVGVNRQTDKGKVAQLRVSVCEVDVPVGLGKAGIFEEPCLGAGQQQCRGDSWACLTVEIIEEGI